MLNLKFVPLAVAALFSVASCQTTLGVAGGGAGGAVGVSTTVGQSRGDFIARGPMVVVPDPNVPGRFEVLRTAGQGPSDYWCAAGQFVIERSHLRPGTRIYVDQPMGPGKIGRGQSVGFTTSPSAALKATADAHDNGLSMSIDEVGENWGAEHGRTQCKSQVGFFF
ncbi:MAG: hypothetical protein ACSHXD_17915 [Marinosulfonomonas sp.]